MLTFYSCDIFLKLKRKTKIEQVVVIKMTIELSLI